MCEEEKAIPVSMVKALAGFEQTNDYQLKKVPGNHLFFWLESADGPSFILTKPAFFFSDYKVEAKLGDLEDLATRGEQLEVYAIVTVPEKPVEMTANLMAPILINEEKGLGCQLVLHDSQYTTRHYLFPPEKRRHCG
ncbi:MAG: flagellar assembly protein FliW [Dethiobacter sp.]|jgi:flagellar assembly factor FliW|nr:flagellar assembly protein FliW [Dethiobacter sp.]